MDKVHSDGYSGFNVNLDGIHARICHRCSKTWILGRVLWDPWPTGVFPSILGNDNSFALSLPNARLCMEVCQAHVLSANVSSYSRDSEIQHPRLQAKVSLHFFCGWNNFVVLIIYGRMEQFQKAIRKVRQVQRMRKQRGYAFSQADEGATRLIQAYDTTKERGRYGEMQSAAGPIPRR
jgi:hypothetical protein